MTVKENQPRLRADIPHLFEPDRSLVKGFNTGPTDVRTARTVNGGHGRLEIRTLLPIRMKHSNCSCTPPADFENALVSRAIALASDVAG